MTGKEFKTIRLKLGMTQQEFGKMLGYKRPQVRISEFERGVRPISNAPQSKERLRWLVNRQESYVPPAEIVKKKAVSTLPHLYKEEDWAPHLP